MPCSVTAGDAPADLEVRARVRGSGTALGSRSLRTKNAAPRGGKTAARADLAGRVWLKIRSESLADLDDATIRRALDARRASLGPTHAQVGTSLRALARCHAALGERDRAATMYRQAIEIYEGAGRDDDARD